MAQYVYTMNRVGKIVPPKRQILKDISLSFFPGAKIGVLGLNGSGKSTLLKIMAGLDKEIEGEATEAMPSPALGADSNPPEGREPNILRGPVRPSAEAVDRHNANHLPYMSWSPVCVEAQGKEDAHP